MKISIKYELTRKPDDCSLYLYMLIFLICRLITPQSSIGKSLRTFVLEAWVQIMAQPFLIVSLIKLLDLFMPQFLN